MANYPVQIIEFGDNSNPVSLTAEKHERHSWFVTDKLVDPVQFSAAQLAAGKRHEAAPDEFIPVAVPSNLSKIYGFKPRHSSFFYYKSFIAPASRDSVLAIRLGKINDVDRVYLNGILIGKSGGLANPNGHAWDKIRIYSVPATVLRPLEKNILIIQVHSYFPNEFGITRDRLEIGDSDRMNRELIITDISAIIFLACYVTFGGYFLFLFVRRSQEKQYLLFFIFVASFTCYQFLQTQVKYSLFPGFLTLKRIEYIALQCIAPAFYFYLREFFKLRRNRFFRFVHFGALGMLLLNVPLFALLVFTDDVTVWARYNELLTVNLGMLFFMTVCVIMGGFMILKKDKDARIIMAGMISLIVAFVLDTLVYYGMINIPKVSSYIIFIFIMSLAFILANQFVRVQNQVAELNASLQIKITEAQQFNEDLKRLDKLKDEFLANTSHELRTPLNGIIGLAQSTVDRAVKERTFARKPFLNNMGMIIQSGKRLVSLINDILDFSKMRNRNLELHIRAVDGKKVAESALALLSPIAREKGLDLSLTAADDLPLVSADENRLEQILLNLIGNALKFTHAGAVTVRLERQSSGVAFAVVDTGIGISAEHQGKIFESFEQGDGGISRQYGGTGLGLSITRDLLRMQNSEIIVTSEFGKGSTFRFVLPLADEAAVSAYTAAEMKPTVLSPAVNAASQAASGTPPAAQNIPKKETDAAQLLSAIAQIAADDGTTMLAPTTSGANKGKVVLVVDDELVNLLVVENQLAGEAIELIKAKNGFEAFELIKEKRPDIILLDIMMPRMSGYEVCEKIREHYPPSLLPVIFLSARGRSEDVVQGLQTGGNDYLTKPFEKNELLARMNTHLELREAVRSQRQQLRAFHRFVPTQFLELLGKTDPTDIALGDSKEHNISILFSDIRAFTTLSEKMNAEENFRFLNSYLKRMEPMIERHSGFVDKFIGDAIMALFAESRSTAAEKSAESAVGAAVDMRLALTDYNRHRESQGFQPIDIGIGINTGPVMLGTLGSQTRFSTTVIGNAVNLASRLEGLCPYYQAGIVISDFTYKRMPAALQDSAREIDAIIAKGASEPVVIYEVFAGDSEETRNLKLATRSDFALGVVQFRAREFQAAGAAFQKVLNSFPGDRLSRLYLQRSDEYAINPPPADWQGVIQFRTK